MVTMSDVADPLQCVFCGSRQLISYENNWFDCEECTSSLKYSMRRGEIVDHEPPQDLDKVSELLHKLRDY